MYNTIYELILSWIFDGTVITGEIEMVATFLATFSVLFVYIVPFFVVGFVIFIVIDCIRLR